MALSTHTGGAADKAGIVHESLWGVRGFRFVLEGEAESIRIEEPGEDGAEFSLLRGGFKEYWQAKRQITGQRNWSVTSLKDVLTYFLNKHREGDRCVFASVVDAPELRMLEENAKAAESLDEFKSQFLNVERRKHFVELRNRSGCTSMEEGMPASRQAVSIKVSGD